MPFVYFVSEPGEIKLFLYFSETVQQQPPAEIEQQPPVQVEQQPTAQVEQQPPAQREQVPPAQGNNSNSLNHNIQGDRKQL